MAGFLPHPRAVQRRAFWPRELQRAALLLGASAALLWFSFAAGRWIVALPLTGPIYVDLLVAWIAVLVHVSAWPNLWVGLRDLRGNHHEDPSAILAWRSFLLTLTLVFAGVIIIPLEYHSFITTNAWVVVLYVTTFPYLGWTLVPILALHGILFGRVASYLAPRSRRVAESGAVVLFAVSAATVAVVLQNPGATAFVQSWSVGQGLLPAAALGGYVLIAIGTTLGGAPVVPSRARSWTPQRPVPAFSRWPAPSPRSNPERPRSRRRTALGRP